MATENVEAALQWLRVAVQGNDSRARECLEQVAAELDAAAVPPTRPDVPPYEELGRRIGAVVTEKQAAYGDSFGKSGSVMRTLYPDGIPPEKLDDALVVVRVLDKLFRIATARDALGESPWQDISGYGLLAHRRVELERFVVPVK